MKSINQENFFNKVEECELETITAEILKLKINMVENSILLGTKLRQVKKNLKHGQWIPYLEEKVEVSVRTAQKFIKIATEFENTKLYSCLGTEKLYILLSLPKNEREKFILSNKIETWTNRQLIKKIKEVNYTKKAQKKAAQKFKIIEAKKTGTFTTPNCENMIEKRNKNKNLNVIKDQINNIKTNTKKILKKVDDLIEEIRIRTGDFYTSTESINSVVCDDRGGILAQLYAIGEITETELVETIKEYNIELDINFKKMHDGTDKENYKNNVCNSYSKCNTTTDIIYLAIIDAEMTYENVIEFAWENDEVFRLEYVEETKEDSFVMGNITICKGVGDGTEMLCVFKNREALAYYNVDTKTNLEDVTKLFNYYNIDLSYLLLVKQFIKKIEQEKFEIQKSNFEEIMSSVKFTNKQIRKDFDVFTLAILDKVYSYTGDILYIFINFKMIGKITMENSLGDDKFKFELDNNKNILKLLENIDEKLWIRFKKQVILEDSRLNKEKKAKEEKERIQEEKYRQYDNYKNENILGEITMITEENKVFYKKFYNTLAMAYHPDRIGGDGTAMALINQLKSSWGL